MKVGFVDFWPKFNKEYNFFTIVLSRKYEITVDNNDPDILFYSIFGNENVKFEKPFKVFYTGENIRPRSSNYALGFDYIENPKYSRLPLWLLSTDLFESDIIKVQDPTPVPIDNLFESTDIKIRDRFCAFIVGNGSSRIRNRCFIVLSKYKKVDSAGSWWRNTDELSERHDAVWPLAKHNFLKKYKFTICCENDTYPGYLTEKLIQAKAAGTIPIYWGDPTVNLQCNASSFILFDEKREDEFLATIQQIDENDELWYKIAKTPLFYQNKNFYINSIDNIFFKLYTSYKLFITKKYVINLKNRKDRLNDFIKKCPVTNIEIIYGFNGKNPSDESKEEIELFNNKFDTLTPGEKGCFLSHVRIYRDIVSKNIPYAIVFEDDALFSEDFESIVSNIVNDLPNDFDILYIGGRFDKNFVMTNYIKYNDYIVQTNFEKFNNKEMERTTHGYIISNKGSKYLLDIFDKTEKITPPIDHWLLNNFKNNNLPVYNSMPLVCYSPLVGDSDIRN